MTSWRPPGSILEAPDSILEAPRLDLGRFWNDFFEIFGQNAKKAINAQSALKVPKNNKYIKDLPGKDIVPRFAEPPRVGGRRWSPPGGFQLNKDNLF